MDAENLVSSFVKCSILARSFNKEPIICLQMKYYLESTGK